MDTKAQRGERAQTPRQGWGRLEGRCSPPQTPSTGFSSFLCPQAQRQQPRDTELTESLPLWLHLATLSAAGWMWDPRSLKNRCEMRGSPMVVGSTPIYSLAVSGETSHCAQVTVPPIPMHCQDWLRAHSLTLNFVHS